jgi:phospholipid-translocating ATPase
MAISLCHNVTPVNTIENGQRIKELQASSPDEVALVKFAESLNMELIEREEQKIVIQNPVGKLEEYKVLANFPFSSETKRMGIILKHEES